MKIRGKTQVFGEFFNFAHYLWLNEFLYRGSNIKSAGKIIRALDPDVQYFRIKLRILDF